VQECGMDDMAAGHVPGPLEFSNIILLP